MTSTSSLSDPKEYQKIFHWAETQKDGSIPSFNTRRNDPYEVRDLYLLATLQVQTNIHSSINLVLATRMFLLFLHSAIQLADVASLG